MFYALLIIIAVLALLAVSLYNRLVRLRNNRENAFADIDVQLKQRLDLVPQLVEAVKAYMKHESTVLTEITKARASAIEAKGIGEKIAADGRLSSALQGLRVAVEAYPDLKTSTVVQELTGAVRGVEDEIGRQRYTYNNVAQQLNTMVDVVPSNIVAGVIGMQKLEYLQFEEAIERPPTIEF